MSNFAVNSRNRIRRVPDRANYDSAVIFDILDKGLVCHVGIAQGDDVFVLPLAYVRIGTSLYVHGSTGSRLLRALGQGIRACVTVTHVDGLVLAKSAFHHSLNYRSAVIFGTAEAVSTERKAKILDALLDHLTPGRKETVRPPTEAELIQTLVVEIPIEEASAKIRTGPPKDDAADITRNVWSGVIPITPVPGQAIAAQESHSFPTPAYLLGYHGPFPVSETDY